MHRNVPKKCFLHDSCHSSAEEAPLESRNPDSPALRTHSLFTTLAPHTSGTNKKSLLRYSGPLSVVMGAKFQFQNVTFWKELLFFKESMKRWVSAVVSPVSEMPGIAPSRPQPQNGSVSAFTLRRDLLELGAGSEFLGCFSLCLELCLFHCQLKLYKVEFTTHPWSVTLGVQRAVAVATACRKKRPPRE